MAYTLKPFQLNSTDLEFILRQVNFLPLFDALGNAIIAWNGAGAVYDSHGNIIWDPLAAAGTYTYNGVVLDAGNVLASLGPSYQTVTDLAGLRDVSGLNNNLSLVNAAYGAVDQIFTRSAAADYANYSPIMQAVATNAYAAAKVYYGKYSDGSATDGTPTGGFNVNGTLNTDYAITLDTDPNVSALGDSVATDGTAINIKNVVDYTPRMISLTTTTAGVTYDTWANHAADPLASLHTTNEIYYDAKGVATVLDWGVLATAAEKPGVGLGQVDTQERLAASAGQNDHFVGGLNPGVSPSNGFFVLFGQFFDHGLDFVDKASGATIKIALATDDPLYGMIGADGRPVHEITINRATVQSVDANGPQYINHTSPFIDQSQTYGSHPQLTNLLRAWVIDPVTGAYHAGMNLFDGQTLETAWTKADGTVTHETLPTLDELRAHVEATGRDALTWEDVSNLRNRDGAGHVIAGESNSALLLDMNPRFDAGHLHGFYDKNGDGVQGAGEGSYGNAAQSAKVDAAILTIDASVKSQFGAGSTFGIDPATHKLTLFMATLPAGSPPGTPQTLSGASALFPFVNFANFSITAPAGALHDAVGEILMASVGDHYIAGDGRVNENFGLTSIHHIFHEEHNYQVANMMDALHRNDVASGDLTHADLHGFQIDTGHGMNAGGDYVNAAGAITWDMDKVFSGAKLIVEMEYQHAAVDQYARNVTPNIQEFVGYSPSKNPAISLEYGQAAFRFGHSTLRETIDTIDPSHGLTGKIMGYALKEAFLSPEKYSNAGPGAILLGMSHQQMNEVDEFVTPALNQGLLGQPLDLAAINIARGRDLGIPTLNDFRAAIGLLRYTSWTDFGQNMQHASSLVNFIAAYSFDGDMAKANAIMGLVDSTVAEGSAAAQGFTISGAYAFVNGGDQGFNHIDTWLGGLAEVHQPGGLLGETFDKVFVNQIESLMDGDRFYYLYRLAGQQFGEEVANAQLKDIVERNSGLSHLNGNIFGYADQYIDLAAHKEVVAVGAEAQTTGNEHKYGDNVLVDSGAIGIYSNGGRGNLNDGKDVLINGVHYIQDTRLADTVAGSLHMQNGGVNLDGTPNSGADSSEVIVGSSGNDLLYAQGGDDTTYGDGGNDIIFGGYGIDRLYGGSGADSIYGGDNPDLIDGGSGDDLLHGDSSGSDINGADQIVGGSGNDSIYGDIGIDKLSAGSGDDAVYGGQDTDPFTHGGDGNDFVSGDSGGDILYGDNGDDVLAGGADQDQLFGGKGDDILRPGDPTGALTIGTDEVLGGDGANDEGDTPGTLGFDIIDFSDNTARPGGVTFDLGNQLNPATTVNGTPAQLPSFQIEAVIGSVSNDSLTGSAAGDAGLTLLPELDVGENWLVGGSGDDNLTALGGNDIVVGGSVRLDALIGKYNSGYTHNNNNTGLTAADQLDDARYQGASHRVLYSETIDATGIIDAANALGGDQFSKHFTDMLRAQQFKDLTLGDNFATLTAAKLIAAAGIPDSTHDVANFQGARSQYTIDAVQQGGKTVAYKVHDTQVNRDGTDIVVGVETLHFSDQDVILDAAPVAAADGYSSAPAAAGVSTTISGNVLDNDVLLAANAGKSLTAIEVGQAPLHGSVVLNADGTFVYTANAGFIGVDYFMYQASDGYLAANPKLVTLQITNNPPSSTPVADTYTLSGAATGLAEAANVGILSNDVSLSGQQPLAVNSVAGTASSGAGPWTVTGTGGGTFIVQTNGSFVYTPTAAFLDSANAAFNTAYTDTLSYTEKDKFGTISSAATVTVSVEADTAPVANADAFTTAENAALIVGGLGVLANDADANGDHLTARIVTGPTHGALILNADGTFTYTPTPSNLAPAPDTFTYQAFDGRLYSAVQTATVTVTAVDVAPTGAPALSAALNAAGTGATLTASQGTLAGGHGIASIAYRWQYSADGGLTWAVLAGVAGASFTPPVPAAGALPPYYRAIADVTDLRGIVHSVITDHVAETGTSGNTANVLAGTAGADILIGYRGNDAYIVNNAGDVVLEGLNASAQSGGADTVQTNLAAYALAANVENLTTVSFANGGPAIDSVNHDWSGNALANVITGGAGNDTLTGLTGNDTLNGGAGTDRAVYTGSLAATTFASAGGNVTVTTAAEGIDTLNSIEQITFNSGAASEATFNFTAGTNAVNGLSGTAGNDLMFGFGGSDTLTGGAGDDLLYGGAGNDVAVFTGGAGSYQFSFDAAGNLLVADQTPNRDGTDTLNAIERMSLAGTTYTLRAGDAAANTIAAGRAPQLLIGGGGADTFVFSSTLTTGNTAATRDVIGDFVLGLDHITLSGIDANTALGGNNAFTWDGATANDANGVHAQGHIGYHFDTLNNLTIIDGNTNNDPLGHNFQIALRGQISLNAVDFTL